MITQLTQHIFDVFNDDFIQTLWKHTVHKQCVTTWQDYLSLRAWLKERNRKKSLLILLWPLNWCVHTRCYYWLAEINTLVWWWYLNCDWLLLRKAKWWPTEMKFRDACVKISENFNLKFKQCNKVLSPLERNNILALLSTGLWKSLIFQLFVIAAEIKCHIIVWLAFTKHYWWSDFRSQKHGSFSYINCWFNLWVEGWHNFS